MKRKSDLCRECERALFWETLTQRFVDIELRYLRWQNRKTAKKLEQRGML